MNDVIKEKKPSLDIILKKFKNTLESEIRKSSRVFVVGHNWPDFDSIGSAIGLYTIAAHFNKPTYIILNDDEALIEPGVKRILDENRHKFRIIKNQEFHELADKRALLIMTDVNKRDMISIGDSLNKVRNIAIIDHHNENDKTVKTDIKFNSDDVSSASEIVARLLFEFKIKYSKEVANFLLAGINLDTKRFKENTTSKTHDVAEKLIDKGADINYVNNLFLEEFESFARISNLIINGTTINKFTDSISPIQVSFTLNRNNPTEIYRMEDCAKAADRMMKFKGIDAAFALAYIDNETIHISARGGEKVNVGAIMKEMQGGGNNKCAGGKIKARDILEVEQDLLKNISVGISVNEEEVVVVPKVIKKKQIRNNRKV